MSDYNTGEMSNRLLYQVTLASGRVITSPDDFVDADSAVSVEDYYRPVFAEDGRLLTVAADAERQQPPGPVEPTDR